MDTITFGKTVQTIPTPKKYYETHYSKVGEQERAGTLDKTEDASSRSETKNGLNQDAEEGTSSTRNAKRFTVLITTVLMMMVW